MKLLLTTSRKTSVRVRQFIKEFSLLFPRSFIQRSNRGKKSLDELFDHALDKYDRIILITNKHGNPHKIIGYTKKEELGFVWSFEFKLRYVKLSYEFDTVPIEHSLHTSIQFENFDSALQDYLTQFFEPFLGNNHDADESESITVHFSHTENGFTLCPFDLDQKPLPPEILIDEILIEDTENN